MAISPVGSLAHGSGTTLAITTTNLGDIIIVFGLGGTGTVTGGGCTTWTAVAGMGGQFVWGIVTSTGAKTITFGASQGICSAREFSPGTGYTWSADVGNTGAGSGTAPAWPSLTPATSGELYYGIGVPANSLTAGSTPGFTYNAFSGYMELYDTNVSAVQAPTCVQGAGGGWSTFGALFKAVAAVAASGSMMALV